MRSSGRGRSRPAWMPIGWKTPTSPGPRIWKKPRTTRTRGSSVGWEPIRSGKPRRNIRAFRRPGSIGRLRRAHAGYIRQTAYVGYFRLALRALIFFCVYAIVIHMKDTTTSVLSVRVNSDERAILEAAAEQSRTTLSEFMRRKALEAAEVDVLGRTIITIPAKDWEQFEAWIGAPAKAIPALEKLGALPPSWEK